VRGVDLQFIEGHPKSGHWIGELETESPLGMTNGFLLGSGRQVRGEVWIASRCNARRYLLQVHFVYPTSANAFFIASMVTVRICSFGMARRAALKGSGRTGPS